MIQNNGNKNYLAHLTGFRAIAAYLVLIEHSLNISFTYGMVRVANDYVVCLAYLGMSIFFVLSGFVITYTYYDRFVQLPWRLATWNFAVARFARLYPLYIISLFCDIQQRNALIRHATLGVWVSFITLTQSWWNMEMFTFAPAWSISTECFFYVCFALWMLFSKRPARPEGYILRTAIVTLAGILLIFSVAFAERTQITAFLSPMLTYASADAWDWFSYFSPYVRIGEFIAGACAARMFMVKRHDEHLPSYQQRANALCICSGMAIIALMLGNLTWFARDSFPYFLSLNFGYAPFLAYILYACSRYPNMLNRLCSTRSIQVGGEISYSLYIIQFCFYHHVLSDPVAQSPSHLAYGISLLKATLYIILTTIAAFWSYRVIEVPSRRLLRKLLD